MKRLIKIETCDPASSGIVSTVVHRMFNSNYYDIISDIENRRLNHYLVYVSFLEWLALVNSIKNSIERTCYKGIVHKLYGNIEIEKREGSSTKESNN